MAQINMLEAKTKLSKLVEAVESGAESEIILARNGKPVARIVPLQAPVVDTSKRLGIAEGEFGELDEAWQQEWEELGKEMAEQFYSKPLYPTPRAATEAKRKKRA